MNDWLISLEIYFLGFIVAVIMAALIKVLLIAIRRFSPTEESADKGKGGSV